MEGAKRKSFRDSLSKTSLRCSYVVWINRFNKKMYKQPIIPCDLPHPYRFSKVSNVEERVKLVFPKVDCQLDGISKLLPGVNVQMAKEYTGKGTSGTILEPSRFTSKSLPQI